MREVIRINQQNTEQEKPVEFTHLLNDKIGWDEIHGYDFLEAQYVVYLGKCRTDGDMFAAYENGLIVIYKGHLNSGKY